MKNFMTGLGVVVVILVIVIFLGSLAFGDVCSNNSKTIAYFEGPYSDVHVSKLGMRHNVIYTERVSCLDNFQIVIISTCLLNIGCYV